MKLPSAGASKDATFSVVVVADLTSSVLLGDFNRLTKGHVKGYVKELDGSRRTSAYLAATPADETGWACGREMVCW